MGPHYYFKVESCKCFNVLYFTALCSYPHVKVSIRDLSQIFTTAPIFEHSLFQTKYLSGYLGSVSLSISISGRLTLIIPTYNLRQMLAMISLGTSWMAHLKTQSHAPYIFRIFSDENGGENIWEIFAPRRADLDSLIFKTPNLFDTGQHSHFLQFCWICYNIFLFS